MKGIYSSIICGFKYLSFIFGILSVILFYEISFGRTHSGHFGKIDFDRYQRLFNGRMKSKGFVKRGYRVLDDSLIRDDFLLNFDTTGGTKQSHPRVRGREAVVVAFSDTRDGNSDAHFQQFSLAGGRLGVNRRANDDRGLKWQGEPDLCLLDNGNFVLAWEDRRDCNSDVYLQIYDAVGNRVGENIKANDDETRTDQRNVALCPLGEGRFLVVWDDWRNDPGDIYGQIFSEDGLRIGANFRVNEGSWLQYHPSCAADSEGNFVVSWQDGRGTSWDIYARRFDRNGNPLGSDFLVNDDNTTSFQGDPEVAVRADGSFIIVWSDERQGNSDVYGQRYSANGVPIGGNFLVNEVISGNQSAPGIAIDPSGKFFVSYTDDREGSPDIYLVQFDQMGNRIGTIKVNDDSGNNSQGMSSLTIVGDGNIWVVWEDCREGNQDVYGQQLRDTIRVGRNFKVNDDTLSSHQRCSFIGVDGRGEFLVAWEDERNGDIDIYGQRFDSLGNLIGENFKVSDESNLSYQFYPSVARDFSGKTLITWTDTREGDPDIYGQFYDEEGNQIGNNFLINDQREGTQWYPVCAADSAGNFMVVWMDMRGGDWDIYGQRYDRNQNPIGGNFRINDETSGEQMYGYCAMDKRGEFVVVWMDSRDGEFEIYAQRFDREGNRMGNNFRVNEASNAFQGYPACAKNEGHFIIAWEDEREENVDIYAQAFLASGQRIGENFRVNDDTTEEDQYSPSLDISDNGEILFVWCDSRKGDGDLDIFGQRFDTTLRRIGGNVLINRPDSFFGNNQWLIGQGVKIYKDKIGFAWIDNRRRRGWDIYAKLVKLSYLSIAERALRDGGYRALKTYYLDGIEIPEGEVVIYDVKGARVFPSQSKFRQKPGIYIMEWNREERVYRKKFIKL